MIDEISKALNLIKNTCEENDCSYCPLRDKTGICCSITEKSPEDWKLVNIDEVRLFEDEN